MGTPSEGTQWPDPETLDPANSVAHNFATISSVLGPQGRLSRNLVNGVPEKLIVTHPTRIAGEVRLRALVIGGKRTYVAETPSDRDQINALAPIEEESSPK